MKCHFFDKEHPPLKFPLIKISHQENLEYVAEIEKNIKLFFQLSLQKVYIVISL